MCDICGNPTPSSTSRRNFLKLAGAAAAGLAFSGPTLHAAGEPPPKPQNLLSPTEALKRLKAGNVRYINGTMKRHDFETEREALSGGQNPYAGILSCADSRIAPEYAFDTGRGDLFVCRVAGNFANEDSIASFEYGVQFLGVPLILVLGHQKCGAVDATIKAVKGAEMPGHIPYLVDRIAPAVKDAMKKEKGDLLENAIDTNVRLTVEKLKTATPILSKAVAEKKLLIVGGVYELKTGRIDWLD